MKAKKKVKKITSKRGTLLSRDWLQALLMAFLGGFVGSLTDLTVSLYNMIETTGSFELDYKLALIGAISAGLGQLVRKLGQSEDGKFVLQEIKIISQIIKTIKNKNEKYIK